MKAVLYLADDAEDVVQSLGGELDITSSCIISWLMMKVCPMLKVMVTIRIQRSNIHKLCPANYTESLSSLSMTTISTLIKTVGEDAHNKLYVH